jgi:hypothetical protein
MKDRNLLSVVKSLLSLALLTTCLVSTSHAQQPGSVVPTLVNFKGSLTDLNGKPLRGTIGVTFLLYKDEQAGAPLWMETQNVTPDKNGHYTVVLGSTTAQGLPTDLFASGEARWLGVQAQGQAEQPRVLLLSVPYALKAGDAQTVGGLPASAFVLANSGKMSASNPAASSTTSASSKTPPPANPNVTGKGTTDFIPMWDTSSDIVNSLIFQKGSEIGINSTTPAATLDVNGKTDVRDTLTLFPKSTDPTLAISGTSFKIDQTGKVTFISGQTFPGAGTITGVNTASTSGLQGGGTSGTLNLSVKPAGVTNAMLQNSKVIVPVTAPLTGGGAVSLGGAATALALKPCAANQIYVSNGTTWSCSAAGTGTITGVTAGKELTGGGSSGIVTLNLDTTKVPLLASANTFSNTQTIRANNSTEVVNVTQGGAGVGLNSTAAGGTGVSGSGSIGVNGLGTGSSGIGVQAGSTSGVGVFASTATGLGVFSISSAPNSAGSIEGYANSNASGANTPGVTGYSTTPQGVGTRGIWSTASTVGATTQNVGSWGDSSAGDGVHGTSDSGVGVVGLSNFIGISGSTINGTGVSGNSTSGIGVSGVSSGNNAVQGFAHSSGGSGVAGFNDAVDATGVYGSNQNGYGFVTDSHVSQARAAGGWAKAMAFVDPANGNATNGIKWCFNSQIAGSKASTSPCGMGYTRVVNGAYLIDFGFQVSDRFVLATPVYTGSTPTIGHTLTICYGPDGCLSHSATQVNVVVDNSSSAPDSAFYIVVF